MDIQGTFSNVFNKAKSGTIAVSLEAKKKLKESSIKGEISSLESKLTSLHTQIGKEGFTNHYEALLAMEGMKELIDSANDILSQIEAKNKELVEAMEQFDREIAAVKEGADAPPPAAAAQDSTLVKCAKCGTENKPDALFCKQCGNKMEAEPKAEAEPEAKKYFCPQCGVEYSEGTKFCSSCGVKLGD